MSTLPSLLIAPDTCLSEDMVLAFHRGDTTETDRQRIHGHIDSCNICRKLLMATAAMEGSGSTLGVELDSMERIAAVIGAGLHMTTFAKGKQLAHRFDVTRFVDRGGMGEVYEAFDAVVGARVALKALLCTTGEDDRPANRLGEEVKLARRIAHPNVCHIYDLHEHREPGHPPLRFLAMEFVDGVTLKERLLGGELAIAEACAIARQLLLGLGAVHAAGVLHLDVKSQNVMLRQGKVPAQAVVMDFSLSRAFENELRLRTSERHAAGSIGYMSPEQLECQSTLGPAADVYAFGVVLYEMLTGQMPFQAASPAAIMLKQLKSRAAPPSRVRPAVPPALDEFVLTCLSRQARSRFQSAASAIEALDRCLPPASSGRRRRSSPWLRMLGVAALAAATAGTLGYRASRTTPTEVATANAAEPPRPAASGGGAPEPVRGGEQRESGGSSAPTEGSLEELHKPAAGDAKTPSHTGPPRRKHSLGAGTGGSAPVAAPAELTPTSDADRSTPRAAASGETAGPPGSAAAPEPASPEPTPAQEATPPKENWVPKKAPNFLL